MVALPSKLIVGTEPQVSRALADWAFLMPDCRLVSSVIDARAIEYRDFSSLDVFQPSEMTAFLAMSDMSLNLARCAAFSYLEKAGFMMPSFIHPQSLVDPRVKIGKNWAVEQGALISAHVKCGSNLILGTQASVHRDCNIGNHVTIGEGAKIGSQCHLGDCITIGSDVTLREGCVIGDQSRITKPGSYKGVYPAGTFLVDEFSAAILT